jgi:transposase
VVLDKIRRRFPWLELIWADGGDNAWQVNAAVAKVPRLRMEIVKRSDDMKGFVVLPRRWVVERTFSWFGRNPRLARDFENLAETLATFGDPRLHPACPQAPCHGVGRGPRYTVTKVGKSDCEGTFARASGNDQDAPIAAVPYYLIEPAGSTNAVTGQGRRRHPGRGNGRHPTRAVALAETSVRSAGGG